MVVGRVVFGVGVRDSVCVVVAGRLGGVFTRASVTVRETGRFSTAFVRAVGRAVLAGFVKVEGRASPGFGRAALGSRCVGSCDACALANAATSASFCDCRDKLASKS